MLDELKEIKIAVGYTLNGKKINMFPASLDDLANVQVEYVTFPGWQVDISRIRSFKHLPENAKKYIEFIETYLKTSINFIGVGPDRNAMLTK